jgi:hypothetical protein
MFEFEMKGFDKIQKRLEESRNVRPNSMASSSSATNELLNNDFIAEHSSFASFDELLAASPLKVESKEDFEAIPDAEWDTYIAATRRLNRGRRCSARQRANTSSSRLVFNVDHELSASVAI